MIGHTARTNGGVLRPGRREGAAQVGYRAYSFQFVPRHFHPVFADIARPLLDQNLNLPHKCAKQQLLLHFSLNCLSPVAATRAASATPRPAEADWISACNGAQVARLTLVSNRGRAGPRGPAALPICWPMAAAGGPVDEATWAGEDRRFSWYFS